MQNAEALCFRSSVLKLKPVDCPEYRTSSATWAGLKHQAEPKYLALEYQFTIQATGYLMDFLIWK